MGMIGQPEDFAIGAKPPEGGGLGLNIDVAGQIQSTMKKEFETSGTIFGETATVIDPTTVNFGNGDTTDSGGNGTDLSNVNQLLQDVALKQQIQASDIQARPLPSLPSISNVGSVPFSGVVNSSAIPGGFQPLPQVAGGRKKLYQLSKFHGGINQRSSPRDISDAECQEATNITFSNIGRISLLGDIKSTSSGLDTHTLSGSDKPCSGYGLFIFKSGYSVASTPAKGDFTIVCSADGDVVSLNDQTNDKQLPVIASEDANVAPVFYAAGSGLYAADANFATNHTTAPQCAVLVYREQFNGALVAHDWVTGKHRIASPKYSTAAANTHVNLEWQDEMSSTFTATTTDGSATIHIGSSGTGTWNGDYYFFISWLFDNGCETGLTSLVTTGASAPDGPFTFLNQTLQFNFSTEDNDAGSNVSTTPMGGDMRVEGARIYFKKSGTAERFLLAEVNLVDGVKGALDTTFIPWLAAGDTYDIAANLFFIDPPEVYSYSSLNGYYANEVYTKSTDTLADGASGPDALTVSYKTAVVGQNGIVFIGNVRFQGNHTPDGMMFSMPGKPGIFPRYNFFDSPSSDGSQITALASFRDTILQFKENAMFVINVSNPAQFYAQASFRDCGVFNPCQVFTTSFGVIFANKNGCFIYDGQRVISLSNGKLKITDWNVDESDGIADDAAHVPCVGYDPRSQSIIVLKDIGDNNEITTAWVYNMITQSWTEGDGMITNGTDNRHTNFVISPNGYLSICQDNEETLKTYNIGAAATQDIIYQTKDLDFGLPSQTKKIFKVYITYTSGSSNVPASAGVLFGVDGAAPAVEFSSGTFATNKTNEVLTLVPTSAATGIKSFAIKITDTVDAAFEINDISILYRVRPIK